MRFRPDGHPLACCVATAAYFTATESRGGSDNSVIVECGFVPYNVRGDVGIGLRPTE
jgi:hypothetical protein